MDNIENPTLPPITAINVPKQEFDFQAHDWHQEAYWIHCSGRNPHNTGPCHISHPHGHSIPNGALLMRKDGKWFLGEEEVKTIVKKRGRPMKQR